MWSVNGLNYPKVSLITLQILVAGSLQVVVVRDVDKDRGSIPRDRIY